MKINANIKLGFAGRYKLRVLRPDGTARVETDWFDNLITNNGLDLIRNTPAGTFGLKYFLVGCAVGTGTTTPAVTDSSLASFLAYVGTESSAGSETFVEESGATPAYWKCVYSYRFGTGVAAGNLSEICVGHTQTNVFSRALITDSGGTPITITVLSDEVLDVTYELRSYINKTPVAIAFDISGVSYTGTIQPFAISNPPRMDRAIESASLLAYDQETLPVDLYTGISGGSSPKNATFSTYVLGSYQLDMAFFYDLVDANYTNGINLWSFETSFCQFCFIHTPYIPKVNYKALTMNIRLQWDRYTP